MAVSGYLSAELAATCNALGYYNGTKYNLEPHCKETVRDLIRYLRRDEGGSHEIRRYLGNAKLLQTDLLPMVQCHHNDIQLFDITLRLIVNLTNPALLVYNEVVPTDKFEHNYYLEIVSHLQLYKEAFNDHRSWTPFVERLSALLSKSVEDRTDDDQRTVERILILVRNVLHVPPSPDSEQRPDNDASIHDQVLWGLHQSGMIDLLLFMSSNAQESLFFMHILEIICLMLREQPPELLAKTANQRSAEEKNKDDEELLKIRRTELEAKMKKNKKYCGTRHSNFGGTFIIKNMKSTSDNNDLIYHKPIHDSKYISLDAEKKPVKLPKNRQPLKCESTERRSALSVRIILKQVCVEFLNAAYNPLMRHVRECFHRGKAQENDESYYFTAMRFFMEFNRHYNANIKYVSETVSVQSFQFIQKYLETWHDLMTTDKKKLPLWSYRTHLALRAYKELLHNLAFMDLSTDESVRESSTVIKSNIFYIVEYRELLLFLVNLYKKEKYSKKYLVDLIETLHIFLKLLCSYCKGKKMVIQKTATRRKKSSKNKSKKSTNDNRDAEAIWNLTCDGVAQVLSGPIDCEVVPFDATLDIEMDQQKVEAIKKIQFHMKNGDHKQAVALLRASRDVWPENDTFGSSTADAMEELEILKEIFVADLASENCDNPVEEDDYEGSGDEEDYPLILERNFEVIDFIKRLASPKMVKVCNTLLNSYDTNSETTNHCVVKMLYRIAFECKLPAMLFQASLFIKFRDILANYEPKYKELAKLAVFVTRKFVETAETNKTVFVELLFPKHVKDACEIVDGYGSYQDSKNKRIAWEEHEEEELKRLDEEYRANNVKEDKVDWILDNLINKERSKRGVIKKMKELGLEIPKSTHKGLWSEEQEEELKKLFDECDKDLPDKLIVNWIFERMVSKGEHSERSLKKKLIEIGLLQMPVKKLKQWTTEQDEELTELFNEHKTDDDVMARIMAVLGAVRSRQNVVGALLRLGLITDKTELRKKSKKSSKSRSNREGESDDDEDEDDESDDEDERPNPKRKPERPPPPLGPSASALFKELSISKYMIGGLKWLITSLHDNLEDLDADEFDSDVPLLPLSEEPVLSMENPLFQNFLQAVGFKKPIHGQEVYWRISSAWRADELNTRINLFNFFVDNAERNLEEIAVEMNQKLSAAAGESIDVFGRNREDSDSSQHSGAESSDHGTPSGNITSTKKIKKKPKTSRLQQFVRENSASRRTSSTSESENEVPEHVFPQQSSISRRRYASDDSSDEENRNPADAISMSAGARKKRMALDSDDDEVDSASNDNGRAEDITAVSNVTKESASQDRGTKAEAAKQPKRNSNVLDSDDDSDEAPEAVVDGRKITPMKTNTVQGLKKNPNPLDSDDEDVASDKRDAGRLESEKAVDSPTIENDGSQDVAPAKRRSHILDSDDDEDPEESPRLSKSQKRPLDSTDDEIENLVKKKRTVVEEKSPGSRNDQEMDVASDQDDEKKPADRVKKRTIRKIDSDDSD